jgi:hypothetical protein
LKDQLLKSDEILQEIMNLARLINAPKMYFPTFDYPKGDATPFIEIVDNEYCYIISERGQERERKKTSNLHELLYWIFEDITWIMSIKYEVQNRIEDKDNRRISFQKQEELLAKLNLEWSKRCEVKHVSILEKYPYDDLAGIRASYCAELRKNGMNENKIWNEALKKYPNK